MIILRDKTFSAKELKGTVFHKMFPKIKVEVDADDGITEENVSKVVCTKSAVQILDLIAKAVWEYEEKLTKYTGLEKKDVVPNNFTVVKLSHVFNPNSISIEVEAKKGTPLEDKMGGFFFWDVIIDLKAGTSEVGFAGD